MIHLSILCLVLVGVLADRASFDCEWRSLAIDYASTLTPVRQQPSRLALVSDALQFHTLCPEHYSRKHTLISHFQPQPAVLPHAHSTRVLDYSEEMTEVHVFVDSADGSDYYGSGDFYSPLKTVHAALDLLRTKYSRATTKFVELRAGTYYLEKTISLTLEDEYLTIRAYDSEEVWISGARVIAPTWSKDEASHSRGLNVWWTPLTGFDEVLGLRVNGRRGIRSRFPNADPETMGIHTTPSGWISGAKSYKPPRDFPTAKSVTVENPSRNDTPSMFRVYTMGYGGSCSHFDPPASYWCSDRRDGGGPDLYNVPSGLYWDESKFDGRIKSDWSDAVGAIVHAWHAYHWASWMFEVDQVNETENFLGWTKGGFQDARGSRQGSEWFIENIFSELDSPNEWFYSSSEKKLYYFHNVSDMTAPSEDDVFSIPVLKVLLEIRGSKERPVSGVTLEGLGFRDAAYTYMDPHGVPSGGDWALQRTAAVFIEGTERTLVDKCTFERLDGQALQISRYNRDVTVQNSEFAWIGDSAITSWGDTDIFTDGGVKGYDATDGNFPMRNKILNNLIREVGHFEKQSSFYMQAKTALTLIEGNIMFNGPRAGININDGLGGGNVVRKNLVFNTCRESGDHGPLNTWDRIPFMTDITASGNPTFKPFESEIYQNFFVANYQSQEAIDNDDGSAYYVSHHNVLIYGSNGQKNDFDGHDNVHHSNLYAYVDKCGIICSQLPGHTDSFFENSCVLNGKNPEYYSFSCWDKADRQPEMHDNRIFTEDGQVRLCKVGLKLYQWLSGRDKRSTVSKYPDDSVLIQIARDLLGM